MAQRKPLKVGEIVPIDGCFTEEYFVRGLSLRQVFSELGLPDRRLPKGAHVVFARQLPAYHDFELAGWAEFPTDEFTRYENGKLVDWSELDFEETYDGIRFPISIDEAKRAWLMNMRKEKLVKFIPVIGGQADDDYPKGGKASQIIVRNEIECQVVQFLRPHDIFRSVWG